MGDPLLSAGRIVVARPKPASRPRLQLLFALVLGATLFGSLWAIADEGQALAATLVTTGVAVSLLPILIRLFPPLAKDLQTKERDPDYAVTVVGLFV